jgi:hypothetical protein
MTTARQIIEGALGFGLNRLSPGETLDADTAATCLVALNNIADAMNGGGSFLFREILTTSSAISTATGTIGSTWAGLSPGVEILGATYNDGSQDDEMHAMTMAQYAAIADKTIASEPSNYAHDGYATVYFYPVPTGQTVTVRTKQVVSDFADLDTDYGMPKGYKSHLADMLAERMAPSLIGSIPAPVARAAAMARSALQAQASNPAILRGTSQRPNILLG